jgi:hypothetical protein
LAEFNEDGAHDEGRSFPPAHPTAPDAHGQVPLHAGEERVGTLHGYEEAPDQVQAFAIDGSGKRAPSGWSDLARLMAGVLKGWSDTVTLIIGVLLARSVRDKGPTQNGYRYLQGWSAGGYRSQIMAIAMLSLATAAQAARSHTDCRPSLQSAGGMAITAAAWATCTGQRRRQQRLLKP